MQPEVLLLCSKELKIAAYPKPIEYSSHLDTLFLEDLCLYYPSVNS
jgi:hypothetical protein